MAGEEAAQLDDPMLVTAANTQAIDLYHRMGFSLLRRFDAMVWEIE